jgi:long-chain acyl-CoA synthetase
VIAYSATETDDAVGVELTHANLASAADAVTDLVPGGLSSDDGQLGLLPASHVHGMVHEVIRALFNGLTYYPLRQRSLSRTLELIEREDITLVSMVTKMCRQMANWDRNDEYDLSSLRAVCVIGPPIPDATEQTIRSLYDGGLYRLYGTPETGSVALTVPDDTDWPADTLGTTIDDIDAKVVDETFREQMAVDDPTNDSADENGELVVSGPNVTRGYRGRSDLNGERFTEADGKRWFHTGATAYRDKQGLFYLEGD